LKENFSRWQEWRDSNPQPPVLETGALAIELHSYGCATGYHISAAKTKAAASPRGRR
jgi:hypothetical protein